MATANSTSASRPSKPYPDYPLTARGCLIRGGSPDERRRLFHFPAIRSLGTKAHGTPFFVQTLLIDFSATMSYGNPMKSRWILRIRLLRTDLKSPTTIFARLTT